MTPRRLVLLLWGGTTAVLVLLALVGSGGWWPVGTAPTLVLSSLTGAGMGLWFLRRPEPLYEDVPQPPPRPAPAPPAERLSEVRLPSRMPDYEFLFSATVRWWITEPEEAPGCPRFDPRALARAAVVERARVITEEGDPKQVSLVERKLEAALGVMQRDPSGRVTVMAEQIKLSLPTPDRERLDRLATLRKDEELWQHERGWETSRRRYLREDVLRSPGSAVVWWLARNNDDVARAVADLERLGTLSAVANNQELPAWFRTHVGAGAGAVSSDRPAEPRGLVGHLDAFLRAADIPADDERRPFLARRIADMLASNGLEKEAEEVRRRFDGVPDSGVSRQEGPSTLREQREPDSRKNGAGFQEDPPGPADPPSDPPADGAS